LSPIRRLDHVAVLVRDTEAALRYFRDNLGLTVVRTEEVLPARVRLTYLNLGNAYLQLVEPLDEQSPVFPYLEKHGEGVHHIGVGVDDVVDDVALLAPCQDYTVGSGRGRRAIFLPGDPPHNVRVELTDFDYDKDVEAIEGWLPS
jgi:methylmalonyl-CoA/ethylmalonyl-CoA epimerase